MDVDYDYYDYDIGSTSESGIPQTNDREISPTVEEALADLKDPPPSKHKAGAAGTGSQKAIAPPAAAVQQNDKEPAAAGSEEDADKQPPSKKSKRVRRSNEDILMQDYEMTKAALQGKEKYKRNDGSFAPIPMKKAYKVKQKFEIITVVCRDMQNIRRRNSLNTQYLLSVTFFAGKPRR